ncbi:hypothetical protein [Patulibacter minatonensis]|uniref:hypothetical protein n=1 Tax=Patulibacter minatonensis TaxID=298163 RepID=UPI00047DBBE7|nr:hypothetical protein [Patulibacter minatonensis]
MNLVKVRRVGNSNVISLPRALEAGGFEPGVSVLIEDLGNGELRVLLSDQVRERIGDVGRRIVEERGHALRELAGHDRDE